MNTAGVRVTRHGRWLVASALVAGAALVWQQSRRERRRLLLAGEIRPVRSDWTEVGAWRMHARIALPARTPLALPVVLVHGFGLSGAYFEPIMERLGTRFMVYAPDLPGHGKSDTPAEPLDVRRFADALVAWMDAMEVPRASIVGHSFGCQIAADAALRYPDRVARLVLIGPTVDPATRSTSQMIKQLLLGSIFERPSLSAVIAKDYMRMGARLLPEFRFMRFDPIEARLPDIAAPTMLVRGDKDPIASRRWLDEAAQLLDSRHIAVIEGAGHAAHHKQPARLVDAITPFLMEVRADARPAAGVGAQHPH